MHKIMIAGIGPGALEYVTPAAMEAIQGCDILVAGRRNLKTFQDLNKETIEFNSGIKELLDQVEQLSKSKKICIGVSGDPGFYSLLDAFVRRFGREQLQVIPGISSFQYLFCKCVKPWKEYKLVSLHGRDLDIKEFANKKGVFYLTDKTNNPSQIATELIEKGMADCLMTIGENLSYEDERIIEGKPEEIREMEFCDLCVVVVEKNEVEL